MILKNNFSERPRCNQAEIGKCQISELLGSTILPYGRAKLHTQVKKSHSIYPWINGEVEDGCVAPYKTPDIYMTLAEQVLIDAGIHSDFATIHIRRGDVKTKRCKTTLEKIRSYAECSLKNCTKGLPVILFTDERNMTYVNGVKQIFEDIGSFLANIMIFS